MALFRKNDANAAAALVRHAAAEDARRLALELAGRRPMQRLDPMALGLVLDQGESVSRAVQLSVRSLDHGTWSGDEMCFAIVTDQRVVVRRANGELVSLWWSSVVGLEVDLARERMVLDFADGHPCGLFGPQVVLPSVMAIARLYGAEGLIRHPSLESLRDPVSAP